MSGNPIRNAIRVGEPTFGIWQTFGSSHVGEVMARLGFDWILVDTQHGGTDFSSLLGIIQAIELGGSRSVVRVGANDSRLIMRALDLGAVGVVVPLVSTPQDARQAVAAMRYPPAGERSFGPVRRFYTPDDREEEAVCLLMIETAEGLANVDAIAATPGVDGLFVGPMDLALSLGLSLSGGVPAELTAAIAQVVTACERAGIIPGAVSLGADNAAELLDLGVRLLTLGADVSYVIQLGRAELAVAEQLKAKHVRPT